MLEFFKKLFGSKPTATPAPYKVEAAPAATPAKTAKPKAEKKTTVKKATTRKPRAPKA
jgi:SepF-like predicted cell division protein (DUF552 family)